MLIKNGIQFSLSKGVPSAVILLDLPACFDTIDHTTLLDRIKQMYGTSGVALEWFVSHLSNRCQSIKLCSVVSVPSTLKYGVPQGSVLSPILSSMYTTPL